MKKIISMFSALCMLLCLSVPVNAQSGEAVPETKRYVVDEADLLTDSEEAELTQMIKETVSKYKFDLVILTVPDTDGKPVADFADDYYDYNGYGAGENRDGMLFMLSMAERDYYTSTTGYGIKAFTDYGIDYLSEDVVSMLSEGDYFDAFTRYAELVNVFLEQAVTTGEPYDVDNVYETALDYFVEEFILFVVAALFALIVVTIMKSKMKSVKTQSYAQNYIREGSMQLTGQRDLFMYSKISKTPKPKPQTTSSGGSTTHVSSSGTSHGGGGGKF